MEIKLNIFAILNLIEVLNRFASVKGELGLAIYETKKRLLNEVSVFGKKRQELLEKYGKYDEEKKGYIVNPDDEHYNDYAKELVEFSDAEILVRFDQVTPEKFESVDIYNADCTASDYELLELFFVDKTIPAEN